MAIFKRGKTWWTDFCVRGIRHRLSLDTTVGAKQRREKRRGLRRLNEERLLQLAGHSHVWHLRKQANATSYSAGVRCLSAPGRRTQSV
jgi:hypothetical protein